MTYYCTLEPDDGKYAVSFPDLPNVLTYGDTKEEALYNAWEALNGVLESELSSGGSLPEEPKAGPREGLFPVAVEPHVAVAYQLRRLRGSESQSEVARRLGITYQAYQRLENPVKGNPSVKTLERVARALGKKLEVTIG